MNSIGKITEELINKSPFLREAMTDDLINVSALARKLKPEIEASMGKSKVSKTSHVDYGE